VAADFQLLLYSTCRRLFPGTICY